MPFTINIHPKDDSIGSQVACGCLAAVAIAGLLAALAFCVIGALLNLYYVIFVLSAMATTTMTVQFWVGVAGIVANIVSVFWRDKSTAIPCFLGWGWYLFL